MSPRPTPAALRALYSADYFASRDPTWGYAVYEADRDSLRDKARRLLEVVERHRPAGALLDVGCAYGFTLEVARERGWQVLGVEAARDVGALTQARLGVAVHADLLAAGLPAEGLDAVTLWDVVEHLPDPRAALAEVHRILKPGGVFSVVTPDVGSLAARVLGSRWEEMTKMPEHIFFFDRRSLGALLRATGFEPLEWGTVGKRTTLGEAVGRMTATAPPLWRAIRAALRAGGLDGRTAYVDPRWKMSVTARRLPHR
jgi:SAM-dependent methyltransferase